MSEKEMYIEFLTGHIEFLKKQKSSADWKYKKILDHSIQQLSYARSKAREILK